MQKLLKLEGWDLILKWNSITYRLLTASNLLDLQKQEFQLIYKRNNLEEMRLKFRWWNGLGTVERG